MLKSKRIYTKNYLFTLFTSKNGTVFGFFVIFLAQGGPFSIPLKKVDLAASFPLGGQFKWDRRTQWETAVFYILYKGRFLSLLGNLRVVLDSFRVD